MSQSTTSTPSSTGNQGGATADTSAKSETSDVSGEIQVQAVTATVASQPMASDMASESTLAIPKAQETRPHVPTQQSGVVEVRKV